MWHHFRPIPLRQCFKCLRRGLLSPQESTSLFSLEVDQPEYYNPTHEYAFVLQDATKKSSWRNIA